MPKLTHLALTGGGTGGHIVPNIALIQEFKDKYGDEIELLYIGERHGMEEQMVQDAGVKFVGVMTGKVRRYFSWQNFLDIFKIPVGVFQAIGALRKFKPQVVFAKGGFVSFPACVAAWILRIPVVLHESDVVPGLANKMCGRFATKICVSFEESTRYFPKKAVEITGNLVRKDILDGDEKRGQEITGFHGKKPVILVMGGSQGASFLNNLVWDHLDEFTKQYQIIHICGKGKKREIMKDGYRSFEFVGEDLKDFYALADVVVTRSGAITLSEIGAVGLPAILIPLSRRASRGDQIVNAKAFAKKHAAHVMEEEEFEIAEFWSNLEHLSERTTHEQKADVSEASEKIIALLEAL
ncbi:undecaprenyldiphospho-muramoylpentapeptide beta-N-acetylglucosaminyltransferase [Candidatus Peregrinibacteria bacterium]|nr:undecaprenyldiphospho-muramoylpentapeptide beta-N-acetylglucosaminyltransferase [Candidatus Peregrinibacteria bacterium]